MKYSAQKLAKALLKLAKDNPEKQKEIVAGFADFCKEKHLGHMLPNFFKYLELEAQRMQDISTLKIFSPLKPGEAVVQKIKQMAGAQKAGEPEIIEDKDMVAGFIAFYENKIIDASLSNNLRLLKNKLYEHK